MESIYSTAFGFILVLAELVSMLRGDDVTVLWLMAFAVLMFVFNLFNLLDDRADFRRRLLLSVKVWGRDFK